MRCLSVQSDLCSLYAPVFSFNFSITCMFRFWRNNRGETTEGVARTAVRPRTADRTVFVEMGERDCTRLASGSQKPGVAKVVVARYPDQATRNDVAKCCRK